MTVTVSNLIKRFGHKNNLNAAVNDVSFVAPEGKVTTLLGRIG